MAKWQRQNVFVQFKTPLGPLNPLRGGRGGSGGSNKGGEAAMRHSQRVPFLNRGHSRGVTVFHAPLERNRPMRPRILGRMCNSAEIHTKKCHLFTPRPPPLANFWTNFGRLCFKSPTRTLRPVKATNSDLGDDSVCRFVV